METRHPQQHNRRFGSSYRTYEEWKPDFEALYDDGTVGSYRTYEEWKLSVTNRVVPLKASSYRTYEEWKPAAIQECSEPFASVLTVPMRNGNRSITRMVIKRLAKFLPYL
mgnify:CR=1 FL=1